VGVTGKQIVRGHAQHVDNVAVGKVVIVLIENAIAVGVDPHAARMIRAEFLTFRTSVFKLTWAR